MKIMHHATKVVMFAGRRYGYPIPVAKAACGGAGPSTTSRVAFITALAPCEACREKLKAKIL